MDLDQLREQFALPGVLDFATTPSGLTVLHISTPACDATLCLQGAHLTHWKSTGHAPVLFLSERTDLAPGKPIRGGIPICFPWFAARHDGREGPSHGFARISVWELAFAALAGEELHLTLTLAPNELSRSLGFDDFRVACRLVLGRTLTAELTVANDPAATAPLLFEEALHTYYAVSDVREVSLTGLAETAYLDKRDGNREKHEPIGPMRFRATTDRAYPSTSATCTIEDPGLHRTITIAKQNSASTIVWNPWTEVSATLPDMAPDAWPRMLAVETANIGPAAISLAPGATHTMRLEVTVAELA